MVYHVLLAFQCIYGYSDERNENGNGRRGESGVCMMVASGRRVSGAIRFLVYSFSVLGC